MEKNNVVETMIEQHRQLQDEVAQLTKLSENKSKSQEILVLLRQFKENFTEHLKLENDVFYVELLEKMRFSGQDTSKTESFIKEMTEIEQTALLFLDKYSDQKKISDSFQEFGQEILEIGAVLEMRIDSEESGVYSYWKMF